MKVSKGVAWGAVREIHQEIQQEASAWRDDRDRIDAGAGKRLFALEATHGR